jgi:predicted GIY-YIG superfamily endonuclease
VLRDKLLARMREMGEPPDHVRLASEVLGIRGATEALARRLVSQALVMGERQDAWRRAGERICAGAPPVPGVYVLRDETGSALYVGKAVNLRRRLHAHFADRRWRATKPALARAAAAEWRIVGSELEALIREADLICRLDPIVNVQREIADAPKRAIPAALVRDVVVIVPSVEADSVELVGARAEGRWMIQCTRRNGADLAVHVSRVRKFFVRADETRARRAASISAGSRVSV